MNSSTGRVSHSVAGLDIFHSARIVPWNSRTTTAPTSHTAKVATHAARISPPTSCSRPSANASAVCCATTICNGSIGINIVTARTRRTARIPPSEFHARANAPTSCTSHPRPSRTSATRFGGKTRRDARQPLQEGFDFSASIGVGGAKAVPVQESDCRKRRSSLSPRSSASTEIHSSAVCACAMSPGPNTTLGMPPCASTDASEK